MWHYGILSAFCFSMMAVVAGHFGKEMNPSEHLFGRALVGFIALFPLVIRAPKNNIFNLVLLGRGLIGTLAILILFAMIHFTGPSIAISLHSISPIFVLIFAAMFLKERINIQSIVGVCVVLIGISFSSIGKVNNISPSFVLLGILGAALSGGSFTLLKAAAARISEASIYWFFCVIQILVQLTINYLPLNSSEQFHVRYSAFFSMTSVPCICVGLLACAGQLLLARSYKVLSASTASVLSLLNIPFTFLIEIICYSKKFQINQALMIVFIFAGLLMIRMKSGHLRKFWLVQKLS